MTNEVEDLLPDVPARDGVFAGAAVVDLQDGRLIPLLLHASAPCAGRFQRHPGRRPSVTGRRDRSYVGNGRKTRLVRQTGALATTLLLFVTVLTQIACAHAPGPVLRCHYRPALTGNTGPITGLRIQIRARLVDRYLTRCDLASFVAGDANGRRHILEQGARWHVGFYDCTYRYHPGRPGETIISTRCVHRGAYASTVWFDAHA